MYPQKIIQLFELFGFFTFVYCFYYTQHTL